jgi:hypothetical protein
MLVRDVVRQSGRAPIDLSQSPAARSSLENIPNKNEQKGVHPMLYSIPTMLPTAMVFVTGAIFLYLGWTASRHH